ncbi:C-type lectin lectoxin-Lio2-like [Hypanus sabinus]|uniref:C-type lectin lectoxin-Lio2-like n=1 Tax=Hypanus sabinus TaxID=79690 RepID=UPI0028C42D65|nr:C-type lectin lectoxin-Lio2-like [Hypanus sabinus]
MLTMVSTQLVPISCPISSKFHPCLYLFKFFLKDTIIPASTTSSGASSTYFWEGNFTWIDGTDYTYTTWVGGQPDDYQSNEDCVRIDYFTGTPYWNDLSCDTNLGLVGAYKLHCI